MPATAFATAPVRINPRLWRGGLALGLVAAGDWLFWAGALGLGVPAFLALLAGAILLANPGLVLRPERARAALVLALGLAPLIEHVSVLSALIGVAGVAGMALIASDRLRQTIEQTIWDCLRVVFGGPIWLVGDISRLATVRRQVRAVSLVQRLMLWLMPLGLGAVFVLLFADANPVLMRWLGRIDLAVLPDALDTKRMIFWGLLAGLVWGFLLVRPRMARKAVICEPAPETPAALLALFGAGAVLRGLILFNLIFAVQTGLDLVFLWGGARLPADMTYAEYAHRGAYPLIFAALLAGGFTLLATRAGSEAAASRTIRWLAYLWIAQTVWLVVSSILRLDLYVGVYALSHWRVAAFVWMVLVAVGLVLIVARLALGRSNAWLVNAVLLAGLATLYAASFANISGLIARHNVAVSLEVAGAPGLPLDRRYLCALGPAALPAIRSFNRTLGYRGLRCEIWLEREFRADADMQGWRHWSLRNLRLLSVLDGLPPTGPEDLSYRDLDNGAALEPWP